MLSGDPPSSWFFFFLTSNQSSSDMYNWIEKSTKSQCHMIYEDSKRNKFIYILLRWVQFLALINSCFLSSIICFSWLVFEFFYFCGPVLSCPVLSCRCVIHLIFKLADHNCLGMSKSSNFLIIVWWPKD